MNNANFIPLGEGNRMLKSSGAETADVGVAFDAGAVPSAISHQGTGKVIGKTKEERKQIAREHRLAARKEKKKIKSDAKKQRKENAVQHRRLTRNNEKYVKNKDRNKQRAIDMERNKIRYDAVHQAERLAGRYDVTGKLFNVGEVVIMPDGKVKSKAALQRLANEKAQKEAEAKAKAESRTAAVTVDGINVQRQAQIPGVIAEKPKRISNKQKKRLEMLAPKPVPPKPVIPEGYSVPEGEENLIALWDITDEEILRRLAHQKREKSTAAKALRDAQKEKKKLNRAIKAMKKEADNKGILWDPIAARKEVLGEAKYLLPKQKKNKTPKEGSDSDSDSDSDSSDSDSSSESDDSPEEEWVDEVESKPQIEEILKQGGVDEKGNAVFTENFANRPKLNLRLLKAAEDNERQLAERKRLARERRKAENKKKAVEEAAALERRVADEKNARKAARRAARKEAEANGEVVETPVVEGKADAQKAEDKALKSAARKAQKAARKAASAAEKSSDEEMEGVESTSSDNKKRKRSEDIEDESEARKSKKSKKILVESNDSKLDTLIAEQNKARLANGAEDEPAPQYAEYDETSAHIENASSGKKSKKRKAEKIVSVEVDEAVEEKQRKREKKARKAAEREAESTAAASTTNGNTNGTAEQWNPEALTGDEARKEKYLRLLGAKKGGVVSSSVSNGEEKKRKEKKERKEGGKVDEIRKAESELERQFEAGIKLKHDGGGKRRGLGA